MRPTLFLDADGVLHAADLHFSVDDVQVTPAELHASGLFAHAGLLAELLPLDVAVVVHSSWRLTHGLAELRALLGPLGERVVGVTAVELDREEGIVAYMQRHRLQERQVVILDDQPGSFTRLRHLVVASDRAAGISAPRVQAELSAAIERASK